MTHDFVDADTLALFGGLFEPNLSVDQSKQCVIAAYSYVAAGLHYRAALADQD
jgi:hypothetical protein